MGNQQNYPCNSLNRGYDHIDACHHAKLEMCSAPPCSILHDQIVLLGLVSLVAHSYCCTKAVTLGMVVAVKENRG